MQTVDTDGDGDGVASETGGPKELQAPVTGVAEGIQEQPTSKNILPMNAACRYMQMETVGPEHDGVAPGSETSQGGLRPDPDAPVSRPASSSQCEPQSL